jgi:WD40 repeat protein/serine/threonine protein kinase/tetratricopeptide (TPR) repeat protein
MRQPPEALKQKADSQVLDEIVDQITEKLQAGKPFDVDEYVRQYPDLEDQLRKLLPGIQMLADLGHAPVETSLTEGRDASGPQKPTHGTLGDYRIIREIGRGGMGVVYEAEQVSLGRKVALKVLPFAAMMDRRQLQRFQNEARAAASLRHPSIVQVHHVGCERAVHFYAMDYIEGRTLAELIHNLRRIEGLDSEAPLDGGEGVLALADSLASGEFAPPRGGSDAQAPTIAYAQDHTPGVATETQRTPQAAVSTERSAKSPAYFRSIAEIGVQVAEALDHAHQHGVIHRDVKPSNVILDNSGKPWITDFGLARIETDATLTVTGDLLGTVRYMSPEQAMARRIVIDHRTDVYSLGVTLYELLTLEPVFSGQDRQELLRQIAFEEPQSPRRLNKAAPEELEIIVFKAMAKNPAERYDTAQELADDLRRFLEDRPIRARRPTLVQRAAKWSRRHKPIVWSAVVILPVALVGLAVSTILIAGAYERERAQRRASERNERKANDARIAALSAKALAEEAKRVAQQQEQIARQQRDAAAYDLYAADMRLAVHDWTAGLTGRLHDTLKSRIPAPERPDYRGWEWYYLFSQCQTHRFAFPLQRANPIAFSPDRKCLATVDQIGIINIWDLRDGNHIGSLKGCPGALESISWSPNGKQLAAGGDRRIVGVWDLASGKKVRSLYGHADTVNRVAWAPDGIRLASGGSDGTIRIWDTRTGEQLSSVAAPHDSVRWLDWHSDGNQLLGVAGIHEFELRIWDIGTGAEVFNWRPRLNSWVTFSPDGSRVAHREGTGTVLNVKSRGIVSSSSRPGSTQAIWSPDGQRLASRTAEGNVVVWDAKTGSELSFIRGHPSVTSVNPVWSQTGLLFAGYGDGALRVWDTDSVRQTLTLSTGDLHALSPAFSPDGRRLLVGARFGRLIMWDVESGEHIFSVRSGNTWMTCVAWSPDGKRFASRGGRGEGASIWDAKTGKPVLHLAEPGEIASSVAWSPDGSILAVGLNRRRLNVPQWRVKLYDADTAHEVATSSYIGGSDCSICVWSPDGKRLAAGGGRSVRVWDSALHDELSVEIHTGVQSGDWSSDGQSLALGFGDGKIKIYDATTWEPIHTLIGHASPVRSVVWHPHMTRLASGGKDGTVRIWDTSTGRELCLFGTHAFEVRGVAWSPDGLRLASASLDKTVRVWDASVADRYLKTHGDLRERAFGLIEKARYQEAIKLLDGLHTLRPQERQLEMQRGRVKWLLADQLARDGKSAEAIAIYEQLSDEMPELPDYRLRMPGILFDVQRQGEAIEMLESLVAKFPQTRAYRDELGLLYERRATQLCKSGKFEEASSILLKLAGQFREGPDFRARLAYEAGRAERLEETMALLEKLAAAFQQWPDYRPELARLLARSESWDQAIMVHERISGGLPSETQYRATLANAYARRGNNFREKRAIDEAVADFSTAIRLLEGVTAKSPEGPAYVRQLAQTHIDFAEFLATCEEFAAPGQEDKSQASFERAGQVLAAAVKANPNDIETHKLRARFHERRKEYAPVIESCSRLIELTPGDPEWWCKRGWVRGWQGDWRGALPDLCEAIELDLRKSNHWNVRAIAYEKLGQFDKAFEDYAKAIEISPFGPVLRCNRAVACIKAGHWDKAAVDYAKAVELKPDDILLRYYCALTRLAAEDVEGYREACAELVEQFAETDDLNAAQFAAWTCVLAPDAVSEFTRPVQLAEKVVEKNPEDPSYLETLGGVLYRAERLEEAIQRLTEADRLAAAADRTPKSSPPYTWFFLAMAHQRRGQDEEAKKWFNKAVEYTDLVLAEEKRPGGDSLLWNRRLTLQLLRAEAEELLGVTDIPSERETDSGRTDEQSGKSDRPGNVNSEL